MQSSDNDGKSVPGKVERMWRMGLNLFATILILSLIVVVVASPDYRQFFIEQLAGESLDGIKLVKDVSYSEKMDSSKIGDLYIPKHDTKDTARLYPAVVVIHGGSWRSGQKNDPFEEGAAIFLAKNGFVAFSIDYPLIGKGGGFPKGVLAVKESIQYLTDHSKKYNIDKNRLFLLGYSSGAQLAMLAAYTKGQESFLLSPQSTDKSSIVAVASFAAPSNLECEDKAIIRNYLKNYSNKSGTAAEKLASPINYVTSAVPTILVHGTKDTNVPIQQSEDMAKALSESHIENKLVRIEEGSHLILPATRKAAMNQVREFFNKQLQKKSSLKE